MIYLGGAMASRMDRYDMEKSKTTRRSQRNKILYERMDALISHPKEEEEEERLGTTRIERLFQNYDIYKKEESRQSRFKEETDFPYFDEDEQNYRLLKQMNQNTKEYLKTYKLPRGITPEEDNKIKQMISTITNAGRMDGNRHLTSSLSDVKEFYNLNPKQSTPKKSIETLLAEAKFLVQKKRNEFHLKEMNQVLHPYGEEKKEEMQKFNLKIKYISLALFLILSFVIVLLIVYKIR